MNNINKNRYKFPFLIGGGIDCLLTPQKMKKFINKPYTEIKFDILEEIKRVRKNNLTGISISVPNIGDDEAASICDILKLSNEYSDLTWFINVSHSPLSVIKKVINCVNSVPIINFTTLETPRVKNMFKIIKDIDGIIIVQLLDENGLPHSMHQRVQLIKKLNKEIIEAGLRKENIVVDILTPPLGTINNGVEIAIKTIQLLKKNNFSTIAWLNNISVGFDYNKELDILYANTLIIHEIDSIVVNKIEGLLLFAKLSRKMNLLDIDLKKIKFELMKFI